MSKTRLEFKVGLFVAVGLALLAVMMIQFSKGKSLFRQSYLIHLEAPSVGGLLKGAEVLLAGVPVGNVGIIQLGENGTNVLMELHILDDVVIHGDAEFVIEQSGFLGDQYVAIRPTANAKQPLQDGDLVFCEAPFDLQQVARDAAGFLQRIDQTARDLNAAIADLRNTFLSEQTLSNLAETAVALRAASEEANATVQNVNSLVTSNRLSIEGTITNLVSFSERLDTFAASANALVDTNTPAINAAIQDIRESTETLKNLLNRAETGDNLAATLLTDEELADQISEIAYNLSITTSNLNERGLWGIMWKRKQPKSKEPSEGIEPIRSPGDPFH
jgi:phospholipid/cholesterol/gamma-HCH transport system substrate-binding protein